MEKEKKINTSNTEEMVSISRAEYERLKHLEATVADLQVQVDYLMSQFRLGRAKKFGASSEKTNTEDFSDQLCFSFNEAEANMPKEIATMPVVKTELETVEVAAHTRKKHSTLSAENLPGNIKIEVVEHRLSEDEQFCDSCGSQMVEMGYESRQSLVIVPQQIWVREERFYAYECLNCKNNAEKASIKNVERTPSVIPGGFASPEAIAHIISQKFVMANPLYRQEQEYKRMNVDLSRQTMSNWILNATDAWLEPIYNKLREMLVKEDVLHADETPLQVLKEPGKSPQSKSYMWLYRTGISSKIPIILYEYQPNRKGSNALNFLKGFSGWLHADGFCGYHTLPENIRVVGCWAHFRRKFDEAVKSLPKDKQASSEANKGLLYCNKLFDVEHRIQNLPYDEIYEKRKLYSKPIMNEMYSWAESLNPMPKAPISKALHYLFEQWQYLVRFLEDGRLEISNNAAERSIKPFVMGRKNFLFANTPKGAKGSAIMYSIVETAKATGLDPYTYLTHVFTEAPILAAKGEDWAERLLPCNCIKSCRI